MARWSLRLRIGFALIAVAMLWDAAWNWWADAHDWVPLVKPISLSAGNHTSARFEIDTPGTYFVALNVRIPDTGSDYACFVSDFCETKSPVISVEWTVSKNGRPVVPGGSTRGGRYFLYVEPGNRMTRELGTFFAERGEYTIDFHVLKDGGEYASADPRLAVFETGTAQEAVSSRLEVASFFGAIGILSGTLLLLSSALRAWRKRQERLARYDSLTERGPLPRRFQCDPQPAASSTLRPIFWKERGAWIGVLLVAGGLTSFANTWHWMATHSFAPVDQAILLAPGHIRTAPFRISLNDYFGIELIYGPIENPAGGCEGPLDVQWIVYKDGQPADSFKGAALVFAGSYYLSGFNATPGIYELDFEVKGAPACLNAANPRLRVLAHRDPYDKSAALHYWISLLAVGSGASLLLILWTRVRPHPPVSEASKGLPVTVLSRSYWKPQRGLPPARLPAFGLLGVNVLVVLVSIMSVAQSFDRVTPVGLRIRLLRPLVSMQATIGIQPVLVRLEFKGNNRPPAVYVDSRLVSWEDFDAVLRKDIYERPPHWPVYLQGDPELDWGSVAEPIDRIRGLDAEVILLTRNSRPTSTDSSPRNRAR
jgi:hypothetical protein